MRYYIRDLFTFIFCDFNIYVRVVSAHGFGGASTDDADGPGAIRERMDRAWVIRCLVFHISAFP